RVRRGGPEHGRRQPADPLPGAAAQPRGADPGVLDADHSDQHSVRGRAVLPRSRCHPTDAVVGAAALRRGQLLRVRSGIHDRSWYGDLHHRAGVQPLRRRPPRCPGSEGQPLRQSDRCPSREHITSGGPTLGAATRRNAVNLRKGMVVGTTVAVALGLAACGGGGSSEEGTKSSAGFNAGSTGVVNASDKKGGTLKLANSSDIDSLDPARAYYAWAWNFQRAYYVRTLVTPDAKSGKDGLKLQPDLAAEAGKITDDRSQG